MPAWTIIENAKLAEPPDNSDAQAVRLALRNLMQAFYDYGRDHNWTWSQTSSPEADDGGLVRGLTKTAACASFNHNFKWLATQGLGIEGFGQVDPPLFAQFLTHPGAACIDRKWVGNVCSSTDTFEQLKCWKFQGHYWVKHAEVNYDACYNKIFLDPSEIIWTKLLRPDAELMAKSGMNASQLYRLQRPVAAGDHLVQLQRSGPNNWPTWRIVRRDQARKVA